MLGRAQIIELLHANLPAFRACGGSVQATLVGGVGSCHSNFVTEPAGLQIGFLGALQEIFRRSRFASRDRPPGLLEELLRLRIIRLDGGEPRKLLAVAFCDFR